MTTFANIASAFDPIRVQIADTIVRTVKARFERLVRDHGQNIGGNKLSHSRGHPDYASYRSVSRYISRAGYRPDGDAVLNENFLAKDARQIADDSVAAFIAKLDAKIGHLDEVEIRYHGGGDFDIWGLRDGRAVCVEQRSVHKVSTNGVFFVQWPARIYVDGQFTPEASFKLIFA